MLISFLKASHRVLIRNHQEPQITRLWQFCSICGIKYTKIPDDTLTYCETAAAQTEEAIYIIFCNQSKSFLHHPSGFDGDPLTCLIRSSASHFTWCHHRNDSRVCCTSSGSNYVPPKAIMFASSHLPMRRKNDKSVFFFSPCWKQDDCHASKYRVQQAEGAEKYKRHDWIIKFRTHIQY